MLKTAAERCDLGVVQERTSPSVDEIQRQLRCILASPAFHGSKRCQQFLEYVCDKSLSGEIGALKERTIAIEVFGRQPQSDLGEDTIVRVGAREVRKRLALFYITPEGVASEGDTSGGWEDGPLIQALYGRKTGVKASSLGGESAACGVFAGSADLMLRNIVYRMGFLFPLENKKLIRQIPERVPVVYSADTTKAQQMLPTGLCARKEAE